MKELLHALAALQQALPFAGAHVTLGRDGRHVVLVVEDCEVRMAAAMLGSAVEEMAYDGHHWIRTVANLDGLHVAVSGPHHALTSPLDLDPAKVDAALAQASAAIGGSS